MNTEISVVMPIYNAEKYIKQAIQSILNQSFSNFEFIIVDDGSTDNSVSMVKSIKDSRIRIFENEKKGISFQLNYGISQAKADLIARMDADDISDKNRLTRMFEFLRLNPEIDIVSTNCILIDLNNKVVGKICYPELHSSIISKMPIEQSICHASLLMKKVLFDKIYYENEFEPVEDHRLFLQMIYKGFKFHNIQENLYFIRSDNHFKNSVKSIEQKKISYRIGKDFINQNCNAHKTIIGNNNYYYKIALLEYNNGLMKSARKNFINYLKYSNNKIFILIRFIIPSFLGDKVFKYLREKNITNKINYILRKIGIETHRF